jgi:hypothetical protein
MKMILNDKEDCIESITKSLEHTSTWRKALIRRWPDDARNARAAKTLDRLAEDAESLTDDHWLKLQPYYSWASETWRNGLNQTARQVGFHHRAGDIEFFIKALLQNLSLSGIAA